MCCDSDVILKEANEVSTLLNYLEFSDELKRRVAIVKN